MKEPRYDLGLVSVSFRRHSPKEILEAAEAARLSHIEWGSDVHAPAYDRARLSDIAAMQEYYGIKCSSYGTYFRLSETPLEELPLYIEAAKCLNTDVLRFWCGKTSGNKMRDGEKDALVSLAREAAHIAKESGVTLCMECHKDTFTENPKDALALIHAVEDPHFMTYWQPFQWQTAEENLSYAKAVAPYTKHLHVFQWKGEARFPLSDGIAEWREYLSCFPAPRALLLEFMPDDRIETLPREADALRRLIGEE